MIFNTLYADKKDRLFDEPKLKMLGRSGEYWVEPETEDMIPLPEGASLVRVPGHIAVGMDEKGEIQTVKAPGQKETWAVAALLPQGFTRTLLPAGAKADKKAGLPLLGYTAVGMRDGQIYAAAVQSDEHDKWHPKHFNTSDLKRKIESLQKACPKNQIYSQLSHCAQNYSCYTAQNIFYQRWEGGIPTTKECNARCLGCISEKHTEASPPQERIKYSPAAREIFEVGVNHLLNSADGIISFGQGCEGDPVLNHDLLAEAIQLIRAETLAGMININTNAGHTEGIKCLCQAGLDSVRVSMFSCREENYTRYHRPKNYNLAQVCQSVQIAKDWGCFVALNLLTFPGFSDQEQEIEALISFVEKYGVDMIQFRNLNIDPDQLIRRTPMQEKGIGINNMINLLRHELPRLRLGSYTPAVKRRRKLTGR